MLSNSRVSSNCRFHVGRYLTYFEQARGKLQVRENGTELQGKKLIQNDVFEFNRHESQAFECGL